MHVLRSHMCGLDFRMEPPFDCTDDDSGDVAFVKVTSFIDGQDVVEECLACEMHPLSPGVSFERIANGLTPISRLKLPLPKF
jgi:hypothetical protein